jgi:hypothetical protein
MRIPGGSPKNSKGGWQIANRKADLKLDFVARRYAHALGARVAAVDGGFLDKRIRFRGLRFLEVLRLSYKIENRFFAISYDLLYETRIPAGDASRGESLAFVAKLKGRLGISGAEFVRADAGAADGLDAGADDIAARVLTGLNHPLIIERIVRLNLTDISVVRARDGWEIRCRSLVGSVTWNLIPPLTQLIEPRADECVRTVEFFELVADALLR